MRLEVPEDNSAARWIEPELIGETASVTGLVPVRFEAYVRILHPALGPDGRSVRWSDVAARLGREMNALVQWHTLVGASDPDDLSDSSWRGEPPPQGDLPTDVLAPLCVLLGQHTNCAEHCFFGLWTGWTVVEFQAHFGGTSEAGGLRGVHSGDEIPGPRFALPPNAGRDYALLSGPLVAATEIAEGNDEIGLTPTSPNLIWPADCSWFLASDIDFDSTLVGGSRGLIDAIIKSDKCEAWEVQPGDSLAVDV